jgi:hypothetical protein
MPVEKAPENANRIWYERAEGTTHANAAKSLSTANAA